MTLLFEDIKFILLYFGQDKTFDIRKRVETSFDELLYEELKANNTVKIKCPYDGDLCTGIIIQVGENLDNMKPYQDQCVFYKNQNYSIEKILRMNEFPRINLGARARLRSRNHVFRDQCPTTTEISDTEDDSDHFSNSQTLSFPSTAVVTSPPKLLPPPILPTTSRFTSTKNTKFINTSTTNFLDSTPSAKKILPTSKSATSFSTNDVIMSSGSNSRLFTPDILTLANEIEENMKLQGVALYSVEGIVHLNLLILRELRKQRGHSTSQLKSDYLQHISNLLPLQNVEEYNSFKLKLSDDSFKKDVVTFLKKNGGDNYKDSVRRCINQLLSSSFQSSFNRSGKDYGDCRKKNCSKLAFTEGLESLIKDVVVCMPDATSAKIEKKVEAYLKDSKRRVKKLKLNDDTDLN